MIAGTSNVICQWDFMHIVVREGRLVEMFSGKSHDELFGQRNCAHRPPKETGR
jgi:hypothetical protein